MILLYHILNTTTEHTDPGENGVACLVEQTGL